MPEIIIPKKTAKIVKAAAQPPVDAYNTFVRPSANRVFTQIGKSVNQSAYRLFNPEVVYMQLELKRIKYRINAAQELVKKFAKGTKDAFSDFLWFFVFLAIWLFVCFLLWAYRRLSMGWLLLRNRVVT